MLRRDPNRRKEELAKRATSLHGKRLSSVMYYDGIDDQGSPYYLDGVHSSHHILMQGLDLVTSDNNTIGFFWEWFNDYELGISTEGLRTVLRSDYGVIDPSHDEQWKIRIGKTITNTAISTDTDGLVSDCRVEFEDSSPIWICARYASYPNDETGNFRCSGDDTVIIFCKQMAEQIGIDVNA